MGNLVENVHLKDRDGDGRIALRWNLGKLVLRTEGGLSQQIAETSGSAI
jgi:hypothetical protein